MYKSGPFSKAEIFYIENKHKTLTIQEIAEDLGRKVESVQAYIKKNISSKIAQIRAGDHFAKSKGTIVMTETASMISDNKKNKTKTPRDCVTKIKHD